MKKIVPFKKNIIFKTNLSEITSISLENTLHLEENSITGEFLLTGEYKMTDTSIDTEKFSYNLPFDITLDDRYLLDNVFIDIDDFYYEIVDSNVLQVNIDVLIDKLEEKKIIEELQDQSVKFNKVELPIEEVKELEEVREIKEDTKEDTKDDKEVETIEETKEINSLFDNLVDGETYATYKVYIIRDGDTIDSILQKYKVSKNDLENYNDLKEIKLGDKIIIPTNAQV